MKKKKEVVRKVEEFVGKTGVRWVRITGRPLWPIGNKKRFKALF